MPMANKDSEKLYFSEDKIWQEIKAGRQLSCDELLRYRNLAKKVYYQKVVTAMIRSAPKSMDPKKCKTHWDLAKTMLLDFIPPKDEELKALCRSWSEKLNGFQPKNVTDYSENFELFMKEFVTKRR